MSDTPEALAKSRASQPLAAMSAVSTSTFQVTAGAAIDVIGRSLRSTTDVVNSLFSLSLTTSLGGELTSGPMSSVSRPYRDFGAWLKQIRVRAGFPSQSNVEIRGGSKVVNQGKLSHIERGLNTNPSPALLRELATLYKRPYSEVVARWIDARFGVDLLETKLTVEDFLTDDERWCLEQYRRLSPGDRKWLKGTLDRLVGSTSDGREFRDQVWNGANRRSGNDRRQAS